MRNAKTRHQFYKRALILAWFKGRLSASALSAVSFFKCRLIHMARFSVTRGIADILRF
jgi:hypothetical protein